ncbi:hypothetical protein PCC6912_26310 [Chlorogloeopsis fritschii PCC 6912]|uniref:Uncharacterized protein n=1 Tax=Chlorogloeopsis fritschii PCC 6912 TaxID=211165 RepID=A0A3S0ZZG7_CHLFR|nr:hypothetical protein PCC6912_26310 [Chlorogloeopsis fritschii PCC 6912]
MKSPRLSGSGTDTVFSEAKSVDDVTCADTVCPQITAAVTKTAIVIVFEYFDTSR